MSLAGPSAWGAFELPPDELNQWKRSLTEAGAPRVYLSNIHTDARMHLGGIGTGNFEIGADGRFTTWQLFNTLRDGEVPFYFGVKSGQVARLLQTTGGPEWPRVKQVEMTGEYPAAILRFRDDDLPVGIELEAFTPFEPLDTKLSSLPLAVFRYRISNPTPESQTVSLAAMMVNPVGYAAIGKIEGRSHPSFGANVNRSFRDGTVGGIMLGARHGHDPILDRAVFLYLLEDLFVVPPDPQSGQKDYAYISPHEFDLPPLDRPQNLQVAVINPAQFDSSRLADPMHTVIWMEDAPVDLPATLLAEIKTAVEAGATLALSGCSMPLLEAYATVTRGKQLDDSTIRPDMLFDDFEHGYGNWTVEGDAFGAEPAHGVLGNQQPVSGFEGKHFANSYNNGDGTTGKMISQNFTIDRNYIRFRVGGGRSASTQIRLVVDGKTVRAAAGRDDERLRPDGWNVMDLAGRTAHIEIVDQATGGWGHITVDQIVFTDWPGDREVLPLLDALLPLRFSAIDQTPKQLGKPDAVRFRDAVVGPDGTRDAAKDGLEQFSRPVGKGRVQVFAGQLLNRAENYSARVRQEAYATLCSLVGATYTVSEGQSSREPGCGTLALATTVPHPTGLTSFDDWEDAWNHFQKEGRFLPLESLDPGSPTPQGQSTHCALAATVIVPAGGTVEVPFLLTWHYPNKYSEAGQWMGCYYATQWHDALAVMRDALANYDRLCRRTELYRQTFYGSTLPYWLLDAMTANSGILRHIGVVFRIANGEIYGWEGSNGSCDPTCTHVWGYEQSLSRLFPDQERSMRRIDFKHQQNPDGGINNRTEVPSPPHPTGQSPFTDGHASCVLKAYREALNCSDDSFFKEYWPHVKLAVEYLINRDAAANGGQPCGVLADDQWNTYDEALHGVTTFISGYYLAALRAGEEWARRMGGNVTADRFHGIFQNGQAKLVERCWNGEYFQQNLPDYLNRAGEVGPGCMADQLLGQWWAHQLGLGYILPRDKVQSALRSIFKYNWKSDFTGWKFAPRAFAGANDKGLIICTWPRGGRPANVMNYSDEVWTGIEYQVAAHMIYEGFLDEGLSIAKSARDRYDGVPRTPITRNPWCEIECGGHYTRAMSSWSLLLALSGWKYDGPRSELCLAPCYRPDNFKSFFSGPEGWGSLAQTWDGDKQRVEIAVQSGVLHLQTLELASVHPGDYHPSVTLAGKCVPVTFTADGARYRLNFGKTRIAIKVDHTLVVLLAARTSFKS